MKYTLPVLIILVVIGCRPAKKIQAVAPARDTATAVASTADPAADSIRLVREVFEKVSAKKIDFKTFSAKMKVDYVDKQGKGPDLTAFVRIKKDSAIWLSINATLFSYEAFRVMITPDSVIVLNKKDKQVQLRSLAYLQEITQLPFDFATVQDLLIGNAVYLDSNIISFEKTSAAIRLQMAGKFFRHLMTLSPDDLLLQQSQLEDADQSKKRTCNLTYSEYENKNGVSFATVRKINVVGKSKLDIDLNIKQYSFNENLSFPFNIPKNYKRN